MEFLEIARLICEKENFSLIHEIGEGSFKKVFLINDNFSNLFALKIIKDCTPNQRIEREVESILRCDHTNIGKLLRFDSLDLSPNVYQYFIEEFFDGGSLSEVLKIRKPTNSEVYDIGKSIIEVLVYLSSLNLVHRDIKPDNIMFRRESLDPILVDFGIVRDLSAISLTQTWGTRGPGTPFYSSPEQLNNYKSLINWRSDQFSLGIVLSICLVNYHPFQMDSEVLYSRETVERVALKGAKNNRVITELNSIGFSAINKMTNIYPAERYRHPKDLLNDWLNQEIIL